MCKKTKFTMITNKTPLPNSTFFNNGDIICLFQDEEDEITIEICENTDNNVSEYYVFINTDTLYDIVDLKGYASQDLEEYCKRCMNEYKKSNHI